jgi:hypothetical protein
MVVKIQKMIPNIPSPEGRRGGLIKSLSFFEFFYSWLKSANKYLWFPFWKGCRGRFILESYLLADFVGLTHNKWDKL